jgi:ParB/RepB/Spo0J family partition protein
MEDNMSEASIAIAVPSRDELRTVTLSAINVRDGFNPRARFDQRDLDRLAASIASRGLLQPLIVTPAEQAGSYELVAGERRYRACFAVGLTEVPVLIRSSASGDDEESLVDAIVENLHRSDHTPLEEAAAFARLLDSGLTRKGICDHLSVSSQRVRVSASSCSRSPGELHGAIDAGDVPLAAVPALVELAAIHPGVAACAYRRVTHEPQQSWQQPLEWADVAADPIGAVTCRYGTDTPDLPDGVYDAGVSYPLAAFPLAEKAQRDLERLAELDPEWGGEGPALMITWEMVEHARTLGAAHVSPHGRSALVVGADVAGELVASVIARHLREARARARRERDHQTTTLAATTNGRPVSQEDVERAQEQARQAERDAQRQARLDAEAYNDRLGAAIVKTLSTVKLDARVIRILTAVDLHGELDGIAMRGARYGFPTGSRSRRPRARRPSASTSNGRRPLPRHATISTVASGRARSRDACLALIAMAVLGDEECVPRSNRSGHDLYRYRTNPYYDIGSPSGLQWARSVVGLVEEICLEQLPAAASERLRERREREQGDREQADAEDRAAQAAYQLVGQFDTLSADQRDAAIIRFEHDHPAGDFLAEQLQTRHEELAALAETPVGSDAPDGVVEQAA